MSTYAIGDVQGCFGTLRALLSEIGFDRTNDCLWFVGDLINRGPRSLECLRFVQDLGDRAVTVLGNHDLNLLAVAEGIRRPGRNDTLDSILEASDRDAVLAWLRQRPMLHDEGNWVMVHAGLLPQWTRSQADSIAREVEAALRGPGYRDLLIGMYGNEPDRWRDDLTGIDRLRIAINAMTRMRFIRADGRIDLKFKGELDDAPAGLRPWFEKRDESFATTTIIAGHWSALGLYLTPYFSGIDTGCVWGRELTALRLEDRRIFQVACQAGEAASGWD